MTAAGGATGTGVIYSMTEGGTFTKKYDLYRYEGGSPKGEVVKASNGLYYGVTEFGGTNGVGVLFSYDPATTAYTVLQNFTTSASGFGARPIRGLTLAANGRLYGMCSQGGANNLGTLFEYIIATNAITKRVDFDATGAASKGNSPRGRLVQVSNNLMYGVTQLGGANGRGTIFRVSATGTSFTKLYDFPALPAVATGAQPFTGLTLGSNGLLYGTTQLGGANGGGVIFSFNITGSVYTNVYDFTQATGRFPVAELVQASNGKFYGTATQGGTNNSGVLFSYDPVADAYVDIVNMSGTTGYNPLSRMIIGSNGLLYGTADLGGTSSAGVIYSLNTTTNAYSVVYNFGSSTQSDPWGGLIEDPAGTLVGMTNAGGTGGQGSLYKHVISTGITTELVPFSFSNGSAPRGRLLKASNGLFYGTTSSGGSNDLGILFSFNPVTNAFTRLYNFDNTSGSYPLGRLAEVNGNLYGLCSQGGTTAGGTLFEYAIATNTFTKKIELGLSTAGTLPQNGFFNALNGKLYSTTTAGAANGLGSLFEYVPSTSTLTKLHDFAAAEGSQTLADLMTANGLLYGTCSASGQFSKGSLFSWNPATNAYTTLYSFNGLEGATPAGDLILAGNGKLYGTFREEGQGSSGGIFSWNTTTNTYTEEYDFNIPPVTTEGQLSESNLILGTDGLLYGTCSQGGVNGLGNVFRFNTSSLALATLTDFDGATNGATPYDGLAPETVPVATDLQLSLRMFLEGPYNSGTGKMNSALRLLGGANGFPTTEPFTSAGFTQVGSGGETINASVLNTSGDNAVVDWVLVELRDKNNSSTILRTKPALLQSDGDIVALDNASTLSFSSSADNYYVSVRHRNHFGVMTSAPVPLSSGSAPIDFTTGAQATFGTNAQKVVGAVRVNWAGNVLRNNIIQYTGANNDRDPILVRVGSTLPTNTAAGYYAEDVNMDGVVQYTGAGNDRDPILVNVGGTTPNNTISEQIP